MLLWLGVIASLVLSFALSAILSWCGPVDRPEERRMHKTPTPTSGGLAIIAGTAVGLIVPLAGAHFMPMLGRALSITLAVPVCLGLLGALDDLFDIPAGAKLIGQLVLIAVFTLLIPPPHSLPLTDSFAVPLPDWLGRIGVGLWMLVVLNAVNFMDGSNGLVAGSLAIVMLGLGLRILGDDLGVFALFWLCGAAAALGFLPLNFPKARLFQGDAGALFLGGLISAAWMLPTQQGFLMPGMNLFALPIALTPFLTDVLITLVLRARRRERLFDAHRTHLYQRWLAAHGGDHAALARRVWAIVAVYTLLGAAVATGPAQWASLALIGGVLVAVAGWLWIDRDVRKLS